MKQPKQARGGQELIDFTDSLYQAGETVGKVGKEVIFKPNNLTIPRYKILRALAESERGTLPTAAIQEALGVTSGNMTGRLDGLEKLGFVKRSVSEDRRAYDLLLTEKGRQIYADAKKDYMKAVRLLYAGFTAEELRTCGLLLERLLARLTDPNQ